MKLWRIALTAIMLSLLATLAAAPGAALAGAGTLCYVTSEDNLDNNFLETPDDDMDVYLFYYDIPAPVEFYIDLPDPLPSFSSATLIITAEDVDLVYGEYDGVYFNGHKLGALMGEDDVISDTVFGLNPSWILPGHNIVEILIDVNHELNEYYFSVNIMQGEICLNVAPTTATCTRADVSAKIYGGWDGMPVNAYVGGTEQETLHTAHDAFGVPAVLWTFYPPATGWDVSVAPELPAGLDPARWQYKLVGIEADGGAVEEPAAASATIYPCSERVFYFQLIDTGALPGEE